MNNVNVQILLESQVDGQTLTLCVYLCPLIGLGVIGFHGVQIHLTIITADSIQAVPQKTHPHSVSAEAHGSHCCPHVCLWVIPGRSGKQMNYIDKLIYKY